MTHRPLFPYADAMFFPSVIRWKYKHLLKPIYFLMDPEAIHERMVLFGSFLGRHAWTRSVTSFLFAYRDPALEQEILGMRFSNPVGLAAGFDKNGHLVGILPSVGFGFEEVGSVTAEPCAGNPGPRLWRLPDARALAVNYGLVNDGAPVVCGRLRASSPSATRTMR